MTNKYIKLPEEISDKITIEAKEIVYKLEQAAKELGAESNSEFWKKQLKRQIKLERANAWFREQELKSELEQWRERVIKLSK